MVIGMLKGFIDKESSVEKYGKIMPRQLQSWTWRTILTM